MLIINYQSICLTTFPTAPPLPSSDGNNYDDPEDNNHKDDPQEASIMCKAAKTAAASAAKKTAATAKTTGKTDANYL
jgi:hypothetical protein